MSKDQESMQLSTIPDPEHHHTRQCKRTGGCYELVDAFFSTGGGVKGKKNLYPLTL